jgi:hypothetical protein
MARVFNLIIDLICFHALLLLLTDKQRSPYRRILVRISTYSPAITYVSGCLRLMLLVHDGCRYVQLLWGSHHAWYQQHVLSYN